MTMRMTNPARSVPGVMPALMALSKALGETALSARTRHLVHLRASQINGCAFCVDMHARELTQEGMTPQQMMMVSAWQDAPGFDPAERAALALAEAMTRQADRADPVGDALWTELTAQFPEDQLAALVADIAMINLWNRINAATRQPPMGLRSGTEGQP